MTVFIGMTVFNGERHLRSAISSLLEQTYSDFKLVIVDDGSLDSSIEIINEFEKKDHFHVQRVNFFLYYLTAKDY